MEANFNGMFAAFFKGDPAQKVLKNRFDEYMRELIRDPELQQKLIPEFEVGCRRINPSAPYLSALQEQNVQPIFDPILCIKPTGVVTVGTSDGASETSNTLHEADVLIAATGFDTSFRPRIPVVGRNGVDLRQLWESDPVSYMGTGVAGFPNYLSFLGPNTPISNGGLMGMSKEYSTQGKV
ncbi:uncharacterized protein EKO05_0000010 [Ascochyta rabiei]|uniref:uncharacterized protein n=1 Tax=Didymella rabiei TaxID=5454 RepID=UPI00220BF5CE|nr:uncharacterized protein EKO05_0000010 [Ascochyta rabiei]UPX09319.1 hypothetical protein EKO05_0000010 [Ascochyta rabiei]